MYLEKRVFVCMRILLLALCDVNACVSDFTSIIEEAAAPHFKKISQSTKNASRNDFFSNTKENPWYDEECYEKKYYFLHKLDTYRKLKSDENRISMVKARSDYKALLRKRRFNFDIKKKLINFSLC